MKNFIKRTIDHILRKPLLVKPVVVPSLPYVVKIIQQGNGEWYHGYKNPLQHRWHINGSRATCSICRQVIEKQF